MNKKLRIGLLVMFLFLAIGFAAISTTLVINSSIRVGQAGDFDIYFSAASTDEGSTATISNNRQTITFSTKKLSQIGDTVVLDYTVTNDSYNYDANVTVDLVNEDADHNPTMVHADYYTITFEGFEDSETPILLAGRSSRDGKITIRLTKSFIGEDFADTFTLKLTVDAVPRTTLADSYTISGVAKDDKNNILANTPLVAFSTPQVFVTDSEGHYEVTLVKGDHSVYYIPGMSEADLRSLGTAAKNDLRSKKVDLEISHAKDDEDLIFNTDKTYNVGDIVTLDEQKFIYIGDENNKMKLLAMYNINVKTNNNKPFDGRLGIQHKYLVGSELDRGDLGYYGGEYWLEQEGTLDNYMGYATTQWDSSSVNYASSTIYGFVEEYKNTLINEYNMNTIVSARVPSISDIQSCFSENFYDDETYAYDSESSLECEDPEIYEEHSYGCDQNERRKVCDYWFNTSFWVNDPSGNQQGGLSYHGYYNHYPITEYRKFGVRPIILVNK